MQNLLEGFDYSGWSLPVYTILLPQQREIYLAGNHADCSKTPLNFGRFAGRPGKLGPSVCGIVMMTEFWVNLALFRLVIGKEFLCTVRADRMAENSLGMLMDIGFELLPIA